MELDVLHPSHHHWILLYAQPGAGCVVRVSVCMSASKGVFGINTRKVYIVSYTLEIVVIKLSCFCQLYACDNTKDIC